MAVILKHWRVLVVLAVCLAGLGLYLAGRNDGKQQIEADQLKSSIKAERERVADDAKLRDLSDYDFCRLVLGRRGLPVRECDELRRLPQE